MATPWTRMKSGMPFRMMAPFSPGIVKFLEARGTERLAKSGSCPLGSVKASLKLSRNPAGQRVELTIDVRAQEHPEYARSRSSSISPSSRGP